MQTLMHRIDLVLDARNSSAISPQQMEKVLQNILRKKAEGNPPELPKQMVWELAAEHHDQ